MIGLERSMGTSQAEELDEDERSDRFKDFNQVDFNFQSPQKMCQEMCSRQSRSPADNFSTGGTGRLVPGCAITDFPVRRARDTAKLTYARHASSAPSYH